MKKIELTQGQFALVDDEDFEYLNQWKWYAHLAKTGKTYYAERNKRISKDKRILIQMHRLIMNTPDNLEVDHKDGNGLNNQKHNMINCTRQENAFNRRVFKGSSSYKGVFWHKRLNKWVAQIARMKKHIHIGTFVSEIEAAEAYNKKAKEFMEEYAKCGKSN